MSNNNLLPFDLEVALKQPERVVHRHGNKPLGWHYFDVKGLSAPIIDTEGSSYNKEGKYRGDGVPSEYDLMLLPEFTPEEGKFYWVKHQEFDDYLPRGYVGGFFWIHDIRFKKDEVFAIHPEPINPPE
jgi:hypothetical protein